MWKYTLGTGLRNFWVRFDSKGKKMNEIHYLRSHRTYKYKFHTFQEDEKGFQNSPNMMLFIQRNTVHRYYPNERVSGAFLNPCGLVDIKLVPEATIKFPALLFLQTAQVKCWLGTFVCWSIPQVESQIYLKSVYLPKLTWMRWFNLQLEDTVWAISFSLDFS